MRRFLAAHWRVLILAAIAAMWWLVLVHVVRAEDHGQIPANVPPEVRAWFKSVQSPKGVPCCDIADGHRTTWRAGKDGGYEVPITVIGSGGDVQFQAWVRVPPEAVITNAGNPVGEAIVWYTFYSGKPFVRCFVPGADG